MTGPSQIPSIGNRRGDGQYPWKDYMSRPRDTSCISHIGKKQNTFLPREPDGDRIALFNSGSSFMKDSAPDTLTEMNVAALPQTQKLICNRGELSVS